MFRKLHSADAVLIVSSLLIAYFIWLIAKMGNVEEQVLENVPVVVDVPPYLEATFSPRTVNVSLRYRKSLKSKIYSSAFKVLINDPTLFSQAGVRDPQAVTVQLTADDVQHTSITETIEIQRVEPARTTMWLKFRTVPANLAPQITAQPAAGFTYDKALITPPERLLTGPQDRLNSLPRNRAGAVELLTSPIPLTDRRESFTTSVAILLPESVSILDEEARKRLPRELALAVIQIVIKEESTSRTIANLPIQVPTLTRNLIARTEPTSGAVTITGPRSRVESLDPRVILLRLRNPPPEKPGDAGRIPIEARMDESAPADVRIISVTPQVVHLRYETLPPATAPTTGTAAGVK